MTGANVYLKEIEMRVALEAVWDKMTELDETDFPSIRKILGDVANKLEKKIVKIKYGKDDKTAMPCEILNEFFCLEEGR